MEAGVDVALVTGRRFDFARPIMDALGVPLTMIVSNGAVVKDRQGRTLARRVLGRDAVLRILALAAPWRDCAGLLFDRTHDAQIVFERLDFADEKRQRFYELNRDAIAERAFDTCLDEDPVQVMFSGSVDRMRALRASLLARLGRAAPEDAGADRCPAFSVSITEYEHRDFALVDVMAPGCSKGSAVTDWIAARGYARAETMAIGDNLNDLEMLEAVGLPIVMGNAAPALRAIVNGWLFTATHDDAGVAQAIQAHILGR